MSAPAPKDDSPRPDPFLAIRLSRLIHGIVHTQIIYAAARLSLADRLAAGPKDAAALAAETGTLAPRLNRLLRALSSLGLVEEAGTETYGLTPLGRGLRSDVPESQRPFALMMGSPWHAAGWGSILHSIERDEPAFDAVFGRTLFDYLDGDDEARRTFGDAMAYTSARHVEAIAAAYDFGTADRLVDVGGGQGLLLAALLERHPALSGVLFDAPAVIEDARPRFVKPDIGRRCRLEGGSFFDRVPEDGDLYMLKYILHDWDDADAAAILAICRKAMAPGARLLVIDAVMPVRRAPFGKTWADIEMMVMLPNGRERTEAEFRALLDGAGFTLRRVLPTHSELSILEAEPAG